MASLNSFPRDHMNKFTYRVFYEFRRTKENPTDSPKSAKEIEHALLLFPSRLRQRLNDPHIQIHSERMAGASNSALVVISTRIYEENVRDTVRQCLNDIGLFGEEPVQPT